MLEQNFFFGISPSCTWAGCRFDLRHNSLQHVTYQILSLTSFLFHIIKRSVFNSGIRSASGKIHFLVLYIYTPTNWKRDGGDIIRLYKVWKKKNMKFAAFVPLSTPTRSATSIPNATHERYQRAWKLKASGSVGCFATFGLMDPFEQRSETKQEKKECRPKKG
jgi:hypothetical protein